MISITNDIVSELGAFLSSHRHDKVFVLTDTNTRRHCLPLIEASVATVGETVQITIEAGDTHKDISQVAAIWEVLSGSGASRDSLLINIGGGMVTDLGGFAGATFKRGLHNLNIPTTLMASVDAAVGGKTGINFNGLKNEIGAFYQPDCVIIDCLFLKTLDRDNLLSGYAEMMKHGLISDRKSFNGVMAFDIGGDEIATGRLNELVAVSVGIKARIVAEDPKEQGVRKALNFGHTVGHALESLSFGRNRPILHGHAVAAGLVSELYLSHKLCRLPVEIVRQVTHAVKAYYPAFVYHCSDYETIYDYMTHDKKNKGGHICFTLLGDIGDVRINQEIKKPLVFESFDFYCENMY
jgi:3-dehydroquinate synthase